MRVVRPRAGCTDGALQIDYRATIRARAALAFVARRGSGWRGCGDRKSIRFPLVRTNAKTFGRTKGMAFRCSLAPRVLTFWGIVVYGAAGHADEPTTPASGETASESGYVFGAAYTGDIWKNTTGGIKRDVAYLDNLDLTAGIDAERTWGWHGATFFGYLLGNFADSLSADIMGDAQGVSNIDAASAVRVLELW